MACVLVLRCCEYMYCMRVFWSKLRPRTVGCGAMCSAVLYILRFRLLLYFAGSGVKGVQVVLSGFSVNLFCPCKNVM